jgi:hypothetical protein
MDFSSSISAPEESRRWPALRFEKKKRERKQLEATLIDLSRLEAAVAYREDKKGTAMPMHSLRLIAPFRCQFNSKTPG